MTLEFDKVVAQVERMGRMLAHRNVTLEERALSAWDRLMALTDLEAVHERVQLARQRDAGFRGAAPIMEMLNRAYPPPPVPARATVVAADGSQVYPSIHAAALYYLTNIGVFVYHHGLDELPEQITDPRLFYADSDLRDGHGQVVTNNAVNARRNVLEMEVLAREIWHRRDADCPILAISDGPLLFWLAKDVPDARDLERRYLGALIHLHDAHAAMRELEPPQLASLIGYVDRPTSTFLVSLLHLMGLDEAEVRAAALETHGDLEGLLDQSLMFRLLQPGERSALMVQQSPQNKLFHDKGDNLEIAFFYLNVGQPGAYHLARIEMPMWVAQDPQAVNTVHALAHDQCQMMWRYPYALTRADELAVVRAHEKSQLNEMIEIEMRRNEQTVAHSEKLDSKAVRHGRRRYARRRF